MAESELRAALGLALGLLKNPADATTRLIFGDALADAGFAEEAERQRELAISELKKWKRLLGETWTEREMERRNKELGYHWFDQDTRRFFGSRIGQIFQGPGGVFFVSSEKAGFSDPRRCYSVRQFDPITGHIETMGDVQGFQTSRAANREAERLARGEPSEEARKLAALLNSLQLD